MQEEEAGPLVVIGGGSAAPFERAVSRAPHGALSVRGGRGAAGGTAASCGALARVAPARTPHPAPAPAPVVRVPRGPLPSIGALPAGGEVYCRALSLLPVSSGEEEYEDDVDIN